MPEKNQAEKNASVHQEIMPEDKLGIRVRNLREKLELTHDGLSSLTKVVDSEGRGISRTTIRGYELGAYKPGARELRILSLALRVSPTWLLIGENESTYLRPSELDKESRRAAGTPRWADRVFPAIAFTQLGADEKRQIISLVETLYRLQKGEVKFRQEKAFVDDFADAIQDFVRDRADFKTMQPEEMKGIFFKVVEDMKERHGEVEAKLLMTSFLPFLDFWQTSSK